MENDFSFIDSKLPKDIRLKIYGITSKLIRQETLVYDSIINDVLWTEGFTDLEQLTDFLSTSELSNNYDIKFWRIITKFIISVIIVGAESKDIKINEVLQTLESASNYATTSTPVSGTYLSSI